MVMVGFWMGVAVMAMVVVLANPLTALWATQLFEYRLMRETQPSNSTYKEFDIYFFKQNATTISLKARQHSEGAQQFPVKQIELKYMLKTYPLHGNRSLTIQSWIKVSTPVNLTVYSREHLRLQLPVTQRSNQTALDQSIKAHLQAINIKICEGIRALTTAHNLTGNRELNHVWLNESNPILEVFMVEKNRQNIGYEHAVFKILPFYSQKGASYWETKEVEGFTLQQIKPKIKTVGGMDEQNVSYPMLLDRIYHR